MSTHNHRRYNVLSAALVSKVTEPGHYWDGHGLILRVTRAAPDESIEKGDCDETYPPSLAGPASSKPRDTTAAARRVWNATKPLAGTIAETCLRHVRGVGHVAVAPSLRFSPALSHPHGRFPCLVAVVQDAHGGFMGLQRISWTARAPRARPLWSLYALLSGP